uniref:Uncharacterized protein n=1 Tax=Oryza brachyantha TaxID=4533 RepID=J3MXF5_ORYBR
MPLPVIHILPRKFHRSILILARGIIRVAICARLKLLHRRNKITRAGLLGVVCVETKVWQDGAVRPLRDLQGNAVPFPKSTLLPCP